MAPTVKVKKSVADMVKWMNTEGELAAELRLAAVAKPLSALDEGMALEVLNGLMEQEVPIDDPTAWVCEAAKAILAESSGAVFEDEEPALDPAPANKVRLPGSTVQRVKELNAGGSLQADLSLAEIAQSLSLVSKEAQEQVLKALEQKAAEVNNPVGWVVNACNRKAGIGREADKGKGKGKGKGNGKSKGPGKDDTAESGSGKPLTASEKKILRTVNFINGSLKLERPINFRFVKDSLDLVDEKTQLRILNKMKDKMDEGFEIANPTTWVKNQCQRAFERYQEMVKEKKMQKRQAQDAEWEQPKPKKKKAAAATAGDEDETWAEGTAAEGDEDWE